jgi:hypothetical protein
MANFSQSSTFNGLSVYTFVVPTSDTYYIDGKMQLPNSDPSASQGPGGGAGTGIGGGPRSPSQVVMTIRQNGSAVLISQPGAYGFILANLPCTAGDVLTFTTTSSAPQDQQPNSIRVTLAISEGAI